MKKTLKYTWLTLCVLVGILVAGCTSETKDNAPNYKPSRPFVYLISLRGESMNRTIPATEFVLVDFSFRYDDISVDDIVLYWDYRRDKYILHEVVGKMGDAWVVKGSNPETNYKSDPCFLMRDNYIAKYVGPRIDGK